jgi:hypothetical protein
MFRLSMSHIQATWTYGFNQTIIINEMLARYGIPYFCTMVTFIKRILKIEPYGKITKY